MYYNDMIKNLDKDLKKLILNFGAVEAGNISGYPYTDLSAWIHGHIKFAIGKKIIIHDALQKEKERREKLNDKN